MNRSLLFFYIMKLFLDNSFTVIRGTIRMSLYALLVEKDYNWEI